MIWGDINGEAAAVVGVGRIRLAACEFFGDRRDIYGGSMANADHHPLARSVPEYL